VPLFPVISGVQVLDLSVLFGCWKSINSGGIDKFSCWRRCPSGVYNSKTTKCVMAEWQAHRVGWIPRSKLLGLGSTDSVDILKFCRAHESSVFNSIARQLGVGASSTHHRLACFASVNTENGFGARLNELLEKTMHPFSNCFNLINAAFLHTLYVESSWKVIYSFSFAKRWGS
jgi:hypothetical protein